MLEVWTWPTPNGHKVHIALEELGLEYKVIPVNIGGGDQFKPEFLKITPNHRIPAIVDPDGPGGKPFTLFESAAIMIYLSEKNGGKLIPKDPIGRYKCLEWMMFQMGGVGPMFGQWNHFASYAVEKIPYAIERYTNEVKRLHRVLEHRLAESHWLAGGEYWRRWYPAIRDELLASRRDRLWQQGTMCTHYNTAMALIILQVPNNYLPILQR